MAEKLRVVVEVSGGMARVIQLPRGVEVELRDYDCEGVAREFIRYNDEKEPYVYYLVTEV